MKKKEGESGERNTQGGTKKGRGSRLSTGDL